MHDPVAGIVPAMPGRQGQAISERVDHEIAEPDTVFSTVGNKREQPVSYLPFAVE
jgi:hypothetical protein